MRTYQLTKDNINGAKQAGMSSAINEKGKYYGRFSRAEGVVSRQGTEGMEFAFKTDEGQQADFLTIWTHNKEGKELYGAKVVAAIMACVEARSCTPTRAQVRKYDTESRQEELCDAMVYPELMNKPIGLLLAREEYEDREGNRKWKNAIVLPFEHATDRTAREKLEGAQAADLPKLVERLRDKPLANGKGNSGKARGNSRGNSGADGDYGGGGFDDMDDDIPF
jgi:hypothetical protein